MTFADYHVHCSFSDDSKEPMENQIKRAMELGLTELCFTDHVDYGIKRDWDDPKGILYRGGDGVNSNPEDLEPLTNVNYPEYFALLHEMKKKYQGKIIIRQGLEFGIQTMTIPDYERLYDKYQNELDFTLLSMHQVDNQEFWNGDFMKGKSQKEYNESYYKEILAVQKQFKHYACLAHLDLLVRYDPAGIYPFEKVKDMVAEILKQAIQDNKGIEVNTSSWHYGLADTQPSHAILKLYKDLGGKIITVGSDGHSTKYLGDHIQDVYALLKDDIGMKEVCTFEHMEPVFHAL